MVTRVIKRDGREEDFDRRKIIKTCLRAGVSKRVAEEIVSELEKILENREYISAGELLGLVTELLEKKSVQHAARYNLKMALLRLGPEGFEFEKFVAALLSEAGYRTRTNVLVMGKCVVHEVDVIAEKNGEVYMIECKFHNFPGIYTGLKDVMYTYSRFLDLVEGWEKGRNRIRFTSAWLFTNTKFSDDAKEFASCRGMFLTGWNYPRGKGIESMLEERNLYPITVLRMEKDVEKALISSGYVFCRDLLKEPVDSISKKTGVAEWKLNRIVEEVKTVIRAF